MRWSRVRQDQPFPALLVASAATIPVVLMAGIYAYTMRRSAQRKEDVVRAVREEEQRRGLAPAAGPDAPLDPVSVSIVTLKQGAPDSRRDAAWRLGEMKARDAVPALLGALRDQDYNVRGSAGEALLKIDPQNAAVVTAVKALLQDRQADVWARLARDFAQKGDPDGIAALTARLEDPQLWSRERAAGSLGSLGDAARPAIPVLIRKLKDDPDYQVRIACARSLGQLDSGPAVKQALQAALADPHLFVQTAAKEALGVLERKAGT
jgi:HEAT repeat protein